MTYKELMELLETSVDHLNDDVVLVGKDDEKFDIDSVVNTKTGSFLTINQKSLSRILTQDVLDNMYKVYHEGEMKNFFNNK